MIPRVYPQDLIPEGAPKCVRDWDLPQLSSVSGNLDPPAPGEVTFQSAQGVQPHPGCFDSGEFLLSSLLDVVVGMFCPYCKSSS